MEQLMERGLKVHLPFLLAQGTGDVRTSSKPRAVSCSCAAGICTALAEARPL